MKHKQKPPHMLKHMLKGGMFLLWPFLFSVCVAEKKNNQRGNNETEDLRF